jgi:peptidoglycan biosynthesis protein MviN/MurJ (putative lipid II flippase)
MAGKALGVVRELAAAALLGTGPVAVAYRLAQAAFLIPLNGVLSDAFSGGFTPAYARSGMAGSSSGRALFAGTHVAVLAVALAVTALLAVLATEWVRFLAPGFDAATVRTTARMVTVLALAAPFYALASLYAAVGIAGGDAALAAARAAWQNAGVLAGTVLAWWSGEPACIAAGFCAAYALVALRGVRSARALGLPLVPRRGEWGAALAMLATVSRSVRVLLFVPLLIQIHLVVERRVASLVSADAVAALDYARFLTDTAVLLVAMPFGLAGLGAMATLGEARFRDLAAQSLRILLYVGVPLSLAVALHAETIVRLVYARGAFAAESVATTTAILRFSAPGIWGALVGYAGAKFLSARGANVRAIGVYAAAFGANVALNLLLYRRFGAVALGVAGAANGVLFGLLIVRALGLFARLRRDLFTLGALGAAYAALAALTSDAPDWLAPLVFAAYWSCAASLVPGCRQVIHDTWTSFRSA